MRAVLKTFVTLPLSKQINQPTRAQNANVTTTSTTTTTTTSTLSKQNNANAYDLLLQSRIVAYFVFLSDE
jgi:hypothetical protein